MLTVEDYRQRAKDCSERAQTAPEPERTKLIELANAWLKLADDGVLIRQHALRHADALELLSHQPLSNPTTTERYHARSRTSR